MYKLYTHFYQLFSPAEKNKFILITIFSILGSFFETLTLGVLVPFIGIIVDPNIINKYSILSSLFHFFGFRNYNSFVFVIGILIICFFLIKNLLLFIFQWYKYRVIYDKNIDLSSYLFKSYLTKPYLFHLVNNSAKLMQNINNEVTIFLIYVLTPLLLILSEGLVTLFIIAVLCFVNIYSTAIILLVFGVSNYFFFIFTHKKIEHQGKIRQRYAGIINQHIMQGLGSIKETILRAKENYFASEYKGNIIKTSNSVLYQQLYQIAPQYFLEVLAIISIMLLLFVLILQGKNSQALLLSISLYAVATIRLMPSLNRIVSALTTLKYGMPSIDILVRDLEASNNNKTQPNASITNTVTEANESSPKNYIKLIDVSFNYDDDKKFSLSKINITIPYASTIGFVGPTGSGKTTLVNIIMGLLPSTSGEILVNGRNINLNLKDWQYKIGYIPQSIYLLDESIKNNIAFGVTPKEIDEKKVYASVHLAQLEQYINTLSEGLNTIVGEQGVRISGGQKQRIGIARALYFDPELIIMDEATSSLDNNTEAAFMEAINNLSHTKTIIIIAHRLSTVQNCDRIFFMKKGKILDSGTYDELIEKNNEFRQMAKIGK